MVTLAIGTAYGKAPTNATEVGAAEVNPARRAHVAAAVADAKRTRPTVTLTKADLRTPMHLFVPLLADCHQRALAADPHAEGVLNTLLVVDSASGDGTIFTVRGFDGAGALGRSSDFRACVKATTESIVLPPIANGGTAEITYPITFAAAPPDNRDTAVVGQAKAAVAAARPDDALRIAESGLKLTSLDGTFRRKLIGIAGVAACQLRDVAKARHYSALASATFELTIREACAREKVELTR